MYSDDHQGVSFCASRDSLRSLADRLEEHVPVALQLDPAPSEVGWHGLNALRTILADDPATPIRFERQGGVVVIAGGSDLLAHVIGGGLRNLADAPDRVQETSVPTHVHFEPVQGPPYSPDSTISLEFTLLSEGDSIYFIKAS